MKLTSLDALRELRAHQKTEKGIQVKVALATCSKAAGAEAILEFISSAVEKRGLNAVVTPTGCMGYCYAEPTIEVTIPGSDPVVFGEVTIERADRIIEQYIKRGERVEGEIPVNYRSIQEIL
jgi:NADP-reducing hydrogenase subunit HndB